MRYAISGAQSCAGGEVGTNLWNPSSTRSIYVVYLAFFIQSNTVSVIELVRTTTEGSGGTWVAATPDEDDDADAFVAPASGTILRMGDPATAPTAASPILKSFPLPGFASSGATVGFGPRGIRVPPGRGLGLRQSAALTNAFSSAWEFED